MYSSTSSMKYLLDSLRQSSVITSNEVYNAMLQVDRRDFTDSSPYLDTPQYIDCNATISAPHMHAYCLEYLKPYLIEGAHVLDVGSGSGYLSVALSKMMNDKGKVVAIEHIDTLFQIGKKNIMKHHKQLIEDGKIMLILGDGRKGWRDQAPFKCIHVGAAAESVPDELVDQLDKGGRMIIPVGKNRWEQYLCSVDKDNFGNVTITKLLEVNYVPLTSVEKQLKGGY